MLVYTVHGTRSTQTFSGFSPVSHSTLYPVPRGARFLGVVMARDIPELWWLEDNGPAVESLQRYYVKTYKRRVLVNLFTPATEES